MKTHSLYIVLFLVSEVIFSQNQEYSLPHYEPFEVSTYNGCPQQTCEWQEQIEDHTRLQLTTIDEYYSNSIQLEVKDGDVLNDERDRSEIALWDRYHETKNNTTFYYSWDFYIPVQAFILDSGTTENYYFMMQWHGGGDGTTNFEDCPMRYPPIQIKHAPSDSGSLSSKRDLLINFGTRYFWCGMPSGGTCPSDTLVFGNKPHIIKNAIELGKWHHIVTKIKWHYEQQGEMQIWIDDSPVISTGLYLPDPCNTEILHIGNSSNIAHIMGDVSLLYRKTDQSGNFVLDQYGGYELESNIFKLGHYRKNFISDNTIYIDNYRITKEYPPSPQKTQIINPDCYTQEGCEFDNECEINFVASDDYILNAYELVPAESYKFKIIDGSQDFYAYSFSNSFNLLNQSWARADKTYTVSVRGRNNFGGSNPDPFEYGKVCTVTTPDSTNLKDEHCGSDKNTAYNVPYSSYSDGVISCYPIPGATNYRFRFRKVDDPNTEFWISTESNSLSTNIFDLYQLEEGATYNVQIRAQRYEGGIDVYQHLPYGKSCYIKVNTIPVLTKLTSEYCNKVLNTGSVYCYPVETAISYVFEIESTSTQNIWYVGSLSTQLNLAAQPWFQYGEVYNIRARAISNNGVNGFQYGEVCTVQINSIFTPKNIENSLNTNEEGLKVFPNPAKKHISIESVNPIPNVKIYNINGELIYDWNNNLLESTMNISVENLKTGVYILRLNDAKKTYFYKILKE